ncbi:MAG: L-threonylcarbamoyladenylate synthase [Gammaproteobacteria bacterium]
MGNFHLNQAVMALNMGGIIAYPTEAVFGLGCYPEDFCSVAKILSLKDRSVNKGLILIAASVGQIAPYVEYPDDKVKQEVISTWPGPVTWVLPAKASVPYWVTGGKNTVAVRVSAHPIAQALCHRAGVIVSTSANPVRCTPATNVIKVRSYFGNKIDYILPGETGSQRHPTEIREATTGKVLRPSD